MSGISIDERGFSADTDRYSWREVEAIGIRTTDEGPLSEDVFWQFLLRDGRVVEVPGEAVGRNQVGVLQDQFPGLDNRKLIEAMTSTTNRSFRLWHVNEWHSGWDDERFGKRFLDLVERLGGRGLQARETFERLRAMWSGANRRYHNLEHLADCLRELDGARAPQAIADLAELALWFHDAVYEPRAGDNEAKSALLLLSEAASMGIPDELAAAAADCVRATAHLGGASKQSTAAADLVVDIDLSILGRDVLRFTEFEYAIREEYTPVTWAFWFARGRFLAGLLRKPFIYRTEYFRNRYETSARARIASLLRTRPYRYLRWLGLGGQRVVN